MGKTVFKTFIYSFTFSLFAIFVVNRVFWSTPKASEKYIYSNRNITLFLKDSGAPSFHASATPAKKIVLSNLNDITHSDKTVSLSENEIAANETTSFTNNTEKEVHNIQKLVQKAPLIPLEISEQDVALSEPTVETKNTDNVNSINGEIQIVKADISPKAATKEENISDADENLTASKKVVYQAGQSNLQTAQKSFDISVDKGEKEIANVEIALPKQQENASITPTQIAKEENKNNNKKIVISSTEHEPQMLIPLEGNVSEKIAQAEVKSAQDAQTNAVAFNAKNTPISSMKAANTADKSTDNNSSSKKNWQSMKDKEASVDDPWVVAKGKSHPNNQMILEDKKYTISDDEVDKIFSKKAPQNSEDELLLASKTVKNLLIPIPEDILNDENLTPQLISSPKNKEIKEELEAKGLIMKEDEEKEETEEEKESSEISSNGSTENAPKESGILNSITSLFSGSNKQEDTPEIGVNETEEENNNSLFSAFTRKQNKLMSKILPTEIRLSFQPNRAEISGQTLKWIKAFAQKTAEEPTTGLEIRIDGTSSPLLQRRRLNLLQNILLNEGAIPEKINTVFTAREPNSFILRTVRLNKEIINTPAKNNNRYMQW